MGCCCFWGETQIWLADLRSSVFFLFSCFVIVVATFCEFVIWTLTLFVKSEFTFILLSGPSLWPASAALRKKMPLHLSQWGSPASRAETWQQISRFVQIKKKRHQCLPWKTPKLETSLLDSAIAGSKKDITLRPSEASHVVALIFCLVFWKEHSRVQFGIYSFPNFFFTNFARTCGNKGPN